MQLLNSIIDFLPTLYTPKVCFELNSWARLPAATFLKPALITCI